MSVLHLHLGPGLRVQACATPFFPRRKPSFTDREPRREGIAALSGLLFFFFLQQILFIYFLEQFRVTAKSSRKIKVPEAEHRRVNLGFSHIPIGLLLPPKHSLPPSEWPTGYDELTLTHQSSSPQVHSLHTAGPILGDVRSVGLTSA